VRELSWPRAGFGVELVEATTEQAQIRPHSRAALLHRLGFAKLIEGNPLERRSGDAVAI
jgi:hypothetical protein